MNNTSSHIEPFSKLLNFLKELTNRNIYFNLYYIREETILVSITVPGQRWEVEFFEDGSLEIERFISDRNGVDANENLIQELFDNFSD